MSFQVGDIVVAPSWFRGEARVVAVHPRSPDSIKVKALTKGTVLTRRWLDAQCFELKEEALARVLSEER